MWYFSKQLKYNQTNFCFVLVNIRYLVSFPSPARVQLLRLHCQDSHVALTESDWQELARLTEGYSGSDLATLVMAATMMPISELQTATHWLCQGICWGLMFWVFKHC